jgi:hypothetical protein
MSQDLNTNINAFMGMNYYMMITKAVMEQFTKFEKDIHNGDFDIMRLQNIFTNKEFIFNIFLLFLKICLAAICIYGLNVLKNYLNRMGKMLVLFFNKTIIYPLFFISVYFKSIIMRKKTKYIITRTIGLITNKLKPNQDLFCAIDWYLNSDLCQRPDKKLEDIVDNVKEIYLDVGYRPIDETIRNKEEINFFSSNIDGRNESIIFNDHLITYFSRKETVEINTDLEPIKKDNIIYTLNTEDIDPNSNILEKLCDHIVREYENYKQKWEQLIFTNSGSNWNEGKNIESPDNIDTIVLKKKFKNDLINSLTFFRKNPSFYTKNGQKRKYICIFLGEPGTGKTTFGMAYAKQEKLNIYNLNLNNSYEGDLIKLIERMDTRTGILLIDDFDHYYDVDELENAIVKNPVVTTNIEKEDDEEDYRKVKNIKRNKISIHEFMTVFDGVGSKSELMAFININDPKKIKILNDKHSKAFTRDRRINFVGVFELCDREMIKDLFIKIFNYEPDQTLIDKIPENKYAPCVIAQQFISYYERNAGNVYGDNNRIEINNILKKIADNDIYTNENIINEYSKKLDK